MTAQQAQSPTRFLGRIELPWLPPATLNPNSRSKWGRIRDTMHVRDAVWGHVKAAQWPAQAKDGLRRRLTITMSRRGILDRVNAYGAVKAVEDGVKLAGALFDDSDRYCDLLVVQERGPVGMVLLLEELTDGH